ncbi:fatty acid hydroxylase [Antarcticibacterium arcticum]|uniref:Fatty acid hydroxylase n=1 Tax=Antarcticibacterium arcticum TaxID=2585771 RepID=A0A5B8YJ23_9FLAO|nr:sterol desaturase family protein [Antarcticibacterium arcticum]QED37940.1 fatty acid hydroxylase [Antarcticibacterium arcticum]
METSKRPKHKGSATLLANPFLERLTHTPIHYPLIIFSVISAILIYYGIVEKGFGVPGMILLFFGGMFFFTFIEYLTHRFLYHLPTSGPTSEKIAYTMHGVHHDYPKDKTRLAMPPVVSLIISTFLFVIYRGIMGDYVFGFLAGFLMGYTTYLAIHYSIHRFRVPNNFFKVLWHHHSIHHYRETDRAFGVTSSLWDRVFGTMPRKVNRE